MIRLKIIPRRINKVITIPTPRAPANVFYNINRFHSKREFDQMFYGKIKKSSTKSSIFFYSVINLKYPIIIPGHIKRLPGSCRSII